MKKIKERKGITLIALVITIIILLILAGITIASLTGENGLIARAKQAREKTLIESAREKIVTALMEYIVNTEVEDKNTVTLKETIEGIEGLTYKDPDECDRFPIIVIVDGYQFEINEKLEVTYMGKAGNIEVPKIKIGDYNKQQGIEETELQVEVEINEERGIKRIELIKVENERKSVIEVKNIAERKQKVEEKFKIYINGTYKIKAYGNNGTQSESEEIKINNLDDNDKIVATIKAGDISNGNINLMVTGESSKAGIKLIEIYVDGEKKKEYKYDGSSKKINTEETPYTVENIEFYGTTKECYAKVKTDLGEQETDRIQIENKTDVKTEKDIQNLSSQVNIGNDFAGKLIKQVEDINLTRNLEPIGDKNHKFSGTYDGKEHKIANINISSSKDYVGLFGYVEGTIENLTIGGTVTKTTSSSTEEFVYCGGIAGYLSGNIYNCTNEATVSGTLTNQTNERSVVGGVVGRTDTGTVDKCINKGQIKCTVNGCYAGFVGGIVGGIGASEGLIQESENQGSISLDSTNNAVSYTGGITGHSSGTIDNCKNNGNITAIEKNGNANLKTNNGLEHYYVGGISGNSRKEIKNCTNNAKVSSTATNITTTKGVAIGGIVGMINGNTINNCINNGEVEQEVNIAKSGISGGIVGWQNSGTVENCKNRGYVHSKIENTYYAWSGGITGGISAGTIKKCSNIGNNEKIIKLEGNLNTSYQNKSANNEHVLVGGIAGYMKNNTNIEECYNEKNIEGYIKCGIGKYVAAGGISGHIFGTIRDCYNKGKVTANNLDTTSGMCLGGIVGNIAAGGTVKNTYNICTEISRTLAPAYQKPADEWKGLIAGHNVGTITNSYYIPSTGKDNTYFATTGIKGGESGTEAKNESALKGLASTLGTQYWTSSSTINGGFPYLKNNVPE